MEESAISIQHKDIPEAQLHEPKGASTAAIGSSYISDGAGSGNWTVESAANEIIVNSLTDFPTPVSGVITLLADTRYVLASSVSTTDRFVLSANTQITSFSVLSPTFEYTGVGTMFTAVDASVIVQAIRLNCPNGQIWDFSDVAVPNTNTVYLQDVTIVSCQKMGIFSSMVSLVISEVASFSTEQGYTIAGTGWRIWRHEGGGMLSTNATFVGMDVGVATTSSVLFDGLLVGMVAGGVGLKGAAASANVVAGGIGRMRDMVMPIAGTALSGIDKDDIRWSFTDNDNIPDTMPDALISMINNATATTITVTGTPVLVSGTWVEQQVSHFSSTAAGRVTYLGERALRVTILLSLSCLMASGSDTDITFSLYKNGAQVTASQQSNTVKASATGNTSLIWQDTVSSGDYFEVFVANEDTTTNIIVQDAKFLIN